MAGKSKGAPATALIPEWRSAANPGVAKQAGRNVGAPPARRNPGEGFIMIRIGKSPKAVRPGAS